MHDLEPPAGEKRKRGRPSRESKLPEVTQEENTPERQVVRNYLLTAPRDSLGFIEGDTPALSSKQVKFLCWLAELQDDSQAAAQAFVTDEDIAAWSADQGFLMMYDLTKNRQREAFKLLTGQLLGKLARVVDELLDSKDWKARAEGAKLLARFQGLLVDRVPNDNQGAMEKLMDFLRSQQPAQVVEVKKEAA